MKFVMKKHGKVLILGAVVLVAAGAFFYFKNRGVKKVVVGDINNADVAKAIANGDIPAPPKNKADSFSWNGSGWFPKPTPAATA